MVTYGWRALAWMSNALVLAVALAAMTFYRLRSMLDRKWSQLKSIVWPRILRVLDRVPEPPPQISPFINRTWGCDMAPPFSERVVKEDEIPGGQ